MPETTIAQPYRYFVSYNFGSGVGSTVVDRSHPVRSYEYIRLLAQVITPTVPGQPAIVVTNYVEMFGPDTQPGLFQIAEILDAIAEHGRKSSNLDEVIGDITRLRTAIGVPGNGMAT